VPPTPAPSTAAIPSSSPSVHGAPVQLVDRWVGQVRPIAGLAQPPSRAFLDIMGAGFRYDAGPGQPNDLLASSVTQASTDVLRFTALSPTEGCQPFDEGSYRWSLSSGTTNLTLALLQDDCALRAAVLPGTWTHTACREAARDCLGPVEGGTYRSTEFDAFRSSAAGQLTYAVPNGWANTADHSLNYALRPAADYLADPGFDGNDTVGGIYLWAGSVAADQPADCSAIAAPDVEVTAAAIADHIAKLDGIVAVDRGTTTVGDRTARVLDVALDPAYRTPCPWSAGDPFRSLIMFADAGSDGGVQGLAPGERALILFVDVRPGRVVSIWVDGEADSFDRRVQEAAQILDSLRIEPPPPVS
jgi:hypothetical protein